MSFCASAACILLQHWLRENNIKSRAGNHFFRGALYMMLRNPHYIGLIKHKKESYPGEHAGDHRSRDLGQGAIAAQ